MRTQVRGTDAESWDVTADEFDLTPGPDNRPDVYDGRPLG